MAVSTLRRLPGFTFEAPAPVADGGLLPRMDVAVFAGFAASGPVNVPVLVEDVARFGIVFGGDAPLAWDADLGRIVYGQLAPAVRMFFANGGRRCWVVRLASGAMANTLPVPGIATVQATGAIAPLALVACSPGRWSDGVALSASLTSRRFGVLGWDPHDRALDLLGPTEAALQAGDLLRLTWPDTGIALYLGVQDVIARAASPAGPRRTRLRVQGGLAEWFDASPNLPGCSGHAQIGTRNVMARFEPSTTSPPSNDVQVTIALDLDATDAPRTGEIIVADFDAEHLLLAVEDVTLAPDRGSPSGPGVQVRGKGLWRRLHLPTPAGPPTVERLGLDLWARVASDDVRRVGDLGLAPGHPRHVQLLPDDDTVYGAPDWPAAIWADVTVPRFPAAGRGEDHLCIPFAVGTLPEHYLPALVPRTAPLERDGLVPFDVALFGDAELATRLSTTLVADAEYIRVLAPQPRPRLTGLHAALPLDEATLIAIPDAAQAGWDAPKEGDTGTAPPPERPADAATGFVDCGTILEPGPVLEEPAHDAQGSIMLQWSGAHTDQFVLEEGTTREWRDTAVVYEGSARETTLFGRRPRDYYYRVRRTGIHASEWSNAVGLRLAPGDGWRVRRPDEYRHDVLVAVHRLLLRFCAARRDALAVLSLPEHYREDAAVAHARLLTPAARPSAPLDATESVPALGLGESDALGFGALYHGWVYTRDDAGVVRAMAPDGGACGVIARRANERGAWVAPANESLRGVIALERPAARGRWQELQQLNINVVRQLPRGFAVMSADTLAPDEDVRPINVRRLLILLRRAATRLGATCVFEPNDDSLRRMVQRRFEAMLGDLYQRGAFAGSTAATAFQVVTNETLNTPQSVDQGRFIVELRVAPSQPLVFVTLRLVQTGERLTVTGA